MPSEAVRSVFLEKTRGLQKVGAQHLSIKTRQEERGDGEGQGFLHQRLLKLEIENKIYKNKTGGEG